MDEFTKDTTMEKKDMKLMRTKTFVVYILHTVFKINVCTILKKMEKS